MTVRGPGLRNWRAWLGNFREAGLAELDHSNPMKPTDASSVRLAQLEHVDERWCWHHQVLLNLRQNLLRGRADRPGPGQPAVTGAGASFPGELRWAEAHQIILEELVEPKKRLAEIDEALRRIRAGSYGVCENTRRAIADERLRVLPWTRVAAPAFITMET